MRRAREAWWNEVAARRDQLALSLIKAKAPYAEWKRALREQEKELLREARTPAERLHLQRLTAKEIITKAYSSGAGARWEEFGPLLRHCQRLGFMDVGEEVHVVCLFVQSLPDFPRKAREAFTLLDAVERKLGRIRKSHYLRREGTEAIAHARRVAEAAGITPPAPRGRTRPATAKRPGSGRKAT